MDTKKLIAQVRIIANILKPLTTTEGTNLPDPYALCWWGILNTTADLLEAQEMPITDKQMHYLKRNLCGGMGSLNDLWFDPRKLGKPAELVNNALQIGRGDLYNILSQ